MILFYFSFGWGVFCGFIVDNFILSDVENVFKITFLVAAASTLVFIRVYFHELLFAGVGDIFKGIIFGEECLHLRVLRIFYHFIDSLHVQIAHRIIFLQAFLKLTDIYSIYFLIFLRTSYPLLCPYLVPRTLFLPC